MIENRQKKSNFIKFLPALFALFLLFILVLPLCSCSPSSVNDILSDYNESFDPDFAQSSKEATPLASLIPADSYTLALSEELTVAAKRGYVKYSWTFSDSSGRIYNCNTGMYVIYINSSSLSLNTGTYTLSVTTVDVSGNKFTDSAVVTVQ